MEWKKYWHEPNTCWTEVTKLHNFK